MPAGHGSLRYKISRTDCLCAELQQLGWAIFSEPVHDPENLPAHVHKSSYEICYIVHGGVDWWVKDEMFEIRPGNIFITFPGEEHGGLHDIMNPCELFWTQIRFDPKKNLPGLSKKETHSIIEQYDNIKHRIFPASSEVPILFKKLIDDHRIRSQYSPVLARTTFVALLVAVIRSYLDHHDRKPSESLSNPIKTACRIMENHLEQEIRIEELAQKVGLSTTAFYKRFADELHLTPGEYLAQRKIHQAKILLRQSKLNITTIAHRLGYSSSQYFATIFKKTTGLTPGQFRNSEK